MKTKPSGLEDHLGYWLRALSNQVSASFADRLERHEVSVPQWVMLRVLHDHETLTLKELGTYIGVDLGALSRMVERLLVRGLVSRQENPASRREVLIALTPAGRKLVPLLAHEADENDRACFGRLTRKQRADLLALIRQLLALHPREHNRIPLA